MRTNYLPALICLCLAAPALAKSPQATLDIYDIDTEGGQAMLFVPPSGKTVLIDTGNPGPRDAARIMEAAKAAGVTRIDYLLITHYHMDHMGGYPELAKLIPIVNYVDRGAPTPGAPTIAGQDAYYAAAQANPHIVAKPGDKLPIGGGVDWTIVSANTATLAKNIPGAPGAGRKNSFCESFKPREVTGDQENPSSVGSVIRFGKFRTVDLGDLQWNQEGALACPVNRIGTIDLLLTTHHGNSLTSALAYAMSPRVVVMNNGTSKGGQVAAFKALESAPGLEDLWQLHWSATAGLEHNAPGNFIANLETLPVTTQILANPPAPGPRATPVGNPEHSPAYWIMISAREDGSFTITNTRNGFAKTYEARGGR